MTRETMTREEAFADEEDCYDEYGRVTPGGLYDAGGHLISESWADYADMLHDLERETQ